MRRSPLAVLIAHLIAAFVWWMLGSGSALQKQSPATPAGSTMPAVPQQGGAGAAERDPGASTEARRKIELLEVAAHVPAPEGGGAPQRAFRFVLNGDSLALEAAEDIGGEFRPRRGAAEWQPGMLCCRLLDSRQRVLAEEAVPAPDHVCVVLDPNTPGDDGAPLPARLTAKGPAVFQVRMPRLDAAAEMKVWRITSPRAGGAAEGKLLATVPLDR